MFFLCILVFVLSVTLSQSERVSERESSGKAPSQHRFIFVVKNDTDKTIDEYPAWVMFDLWKHVTIDWNFCGNTSFLLLKVSLIHSTPHPPPNAIHSVK